MLTDIEKDVDRVHRLLDLHDATMVMALDTGYARLQASNIQSHELLSVMCVAPSPTYIRFTYRVDGIEVEADEIMNRL